jgi:hypothetical protein
MQESSKHHPVEIGGKAFNAIKDGGGKRIDPVLAGSSVRPIDKTGGETNRMPPGVPLPSEWI